jgi:ribose-phosphate pyrophosphokinase
MQCLPSATDAGRRLAAQLGIPFDEIEVHCFPDEEMRVTVGPSSETTIVQASLHQPNDKLLALLFASEALRRGGARRLVLVAPYLCYMRQDTAFHKGEAVSHKVIGKLLAQAFDRVVTVDAHLHRTSNIRDVFPGIEADDLSAMPAVAEALAAGIDRRTVIVGPDEESRPWVSDLAGRLRLDFVVFRKNRCSDRAVEVIIPDPSRVADRPVLLVDDIASSGTTLSASAKALKAAGAASIDAIVTHALFPPELVDALFAAGIRTVKSTDSVPHSTNAIPLDGALAQVLRKECGT